MPRTRPSPSNEPNGPRSMRSATMRRASAGPIMGSDATSSTGATSRSTGGRSRSDGARDWRGAGVRDAYGSFARRRSASCRSQRLRYSSRTSAGPAGGAAAAARERPARPASGGGSNGASLPSTAALRRLRDAAGAAPAARRPRPAAFAPALLAAAALRRCAPSAAIAESTAAICRASADRSAASGTVRGSARTAWNPRAATPSAARPARKSSARFSAGVGMARRVRCRCRATITRRTPPAAFQRSRLTSPATRRCCPSSAVTWPRFCQSCHTACGGTRSRCRSHRSRAAPP